MREHCDYTPRSTLSGPHTPHQSHDISITPSINNTPGAGLLKSDSNDPPPKTRPSTVKPKSTLIPPDRVLLLQTARDNPQYTEWTESLRQHVSWEGRQKTRTAGAVSKRRERLQDSTNLKQNPDRTYISRGDYNAITWNLWEIDNSYNNRGW
ncbi:hypothetical protein F5Y18DRAFT_384374 [Xylariaceae sp. FL1019]|nr:hypothetical protein F5Y18DRAFT_384374 [Xylariaceae sp. FL1019]